MDLNLSSGNRCWRKLGTVAKSDMENDVAKCDMENDLMAKGVLLSACELDRGSLEKHVRVSALAKVGIFLT